MSFLPTPQKGSLWRNEHNTVLVRVLHAHPLRATRLFRYTSNFHVKLEVVRADILRDASPWDDCPGALFLATIPHSGLAMHLTHAERATNRTLYAGRAQLSEYPRYRARTPFGVSK